MVSDEFSYLIVFVVYYFNVLWVSYELKITIVWILSF